MIVLNESLNYNYNCGASNVNETVYSNLFINH